MTALHELEGARAAEAQSSSTKLYDRDQIGRKVHARADFFDPPSIEACREWFGLKREPNGLELLEWALATRGEARGDHVWEEDGNLLTRLGLRRYGALWIGETATASQALNLTHMRIGVGNSATAAAVTDTDLNAAAGSANRQFAMADSVAQGSGANSGVTTVVATFSTGVANFQWNEWGLDGGLAAGTTVTSESASTPGLQNHKVITAPPTKSSIQVAVFTVTVTVA